MRRASILVACLIVLGCGSRRIDLTRSSTQMNVGVDAARMNLWREALFRFQRAVQIDPSNAMAQNNLAVAYEGIGEFEKARAAYTEALKLDRSNAYIQKNYSRFVEFYTRNKKRERKPEDVDKAAAEAKPSDLPVIPLVRPEDKPKEAPPPPANPPANPPGGAE